MQKIRFGNMLQQERGILVHGCNAQGAMGSGIAGQIRLRYPQAYEDYYDEWKKNRSLELGTVVFSDIDLGQGFIIANAITQKHFGHDGKKYVSYEAVYNAMAAVFNEAIDRGLSVHYPQIGAGLAGGDWAVIQTCIDTAAYEVETARRVAPVDRTLWIYE